jgi:hypothetical protein
MAKTTIQIAKKSGKLGVNTWSVDGVVYPSGGGVPLAGLTGAADAFEIKYGNDPLPPGRVWTVEIEGGHWLECLWESDGFFSWWLDGEVVAVNNMGVQDVLLPQEYYTPFVDVGGGGATASYVVTITHA